MAWGKATEKTLTGTSLDITTDQFTSSKFIQLMEHAIRSSSTANGRWQFGDSGVIDTGSVYASRRCIDGGSEITATSQTYIWFRGDADAFTVGHMINIATEEKLVMGFEIHNSTAGAGTAPNRQEWTGKWVETTNQCDKINADNGGVNVLAADSNLSVLGSDMTPVAATPFAENAQAGSRAEITDTRKMYHFESGVWTEEGT